MSMLERIALTAEQQAIIEAGIDGPHVIDAGAGTGKTFTLVQRALRLVECGALRPSQLLIVTFMKKAANEIGERLTVAFARESVSELPTVATFHALAASLVREFAYESGASPDLRGIDDLRARAIFNRAYEDLLDGRLGVDMSAFPLLERDEILPRSLTDLALKLKNRGLTVDEFEAGAFAAAKQFETLPFRQLFTVGKRGGRTDAKPKEPLSDAEILDESRREAKNVAVVTALLRRFDDLLEAESLMTYGDILSRATRMLQKRRSIAERLRDRWRHAMVDEFQDTNPQQLAFLRAIFGENLTQVMAVGDVRQAIFEWNGADPRGIQVIAARPGTRTFPLTINRRSPQQILDAAHAVLPESPEFRGRPLTAHKGFGQGVVIRHASFGAGENTKANRELEANAIADEIGRLLESGVSPSDIVILMRSRTHARIYSGALAARGIFSKTHGGVGFFDAPEIRDAVAWLRLLDDPTDAFAVTRILESPVLGVSQGTIAKLFHAHKVATASVLIEPLPNWISAAERERLDRLRDILRRLVPALSVSAPDAVQAVITETGLDIAHGVHNPATARQVRANVSKLVALAVGFTDDRPLAKLKDFLDEIDERDLLEIDEPEAELTGEEVSIMTVHAAKGLEWDYVFVANVSPAVFPSSASGGETVAACNETSGALEMRYDINGNKPFRWLLRDPHNPETGEREDDADNDEERRLFYVALTRAKREIWISGVLKFDKPSTFLYAISAFCSSRDDTEVFGATQPLKSSVTATGMLPDSEYVHRMVDRLARTPTLLAAPLGKLSYTAISTYVLCPRLARYRYVLRVPDLRDGSVQLEEFADEDSATKAKLDPAIFGNIVHRALELLAEERIEGRPPNLDSIVGIALAEYDRSADATIRIRTLSALTHAAKVLEHYEPLEAEAEFDTTIAGVHVGGFIDLIARDLNGAITIIDYKTGTTPDEYYALQLALYRVAVKAKYPETNGVILRISDNAAVEGSPTLPSPSVVEQQVVAAALMHDDVPNPGIHCRNCPYVGNLCPEGTAAIWQD